MGLVPTPRWTQASLSSTAQEDRYGNRDEEKVIRKRGDALFTQQFTTTIKVYPIKLIY